MPHSATSYVIAGHEAAKTLTLISGGNVEELAVFHEHEDRPFVRITYHIEEKSVNDKDGWRFFSSSPRSSALIAATSPITAKTT